VRLIVEPLAKNEELTGALGGIPYWKGACRLREKPAATSAPPYSSSPATRKR
jgi:hypothetical protein